MVMDKNSNSLFHNINLGRWVLVFIVFLFLAVAVFWKIHSVSSGNGGKQKQSSSKIRLSLNLKKASSFQLVYDAIVNISKEGQGDGTGEWKVKAHFLITCDDVNDNGIMTISQSPLTISIEGTDIEGKHEVDFHSPDKNRQIPELVQGHLHSLIAIKSAKFDAKGKIIAARQTPELDNYDFMAMGKISYDDDQEWILPKGAADTEKVKSIANSMLCLVPSAMGKKFTIGKTVTIKQDQQKGQGQGTFDWTLKDVQNRIAQIEIKGDNSNERKVPNSLVDEVAQFHSLSEQLLGFNIDTGLVVKCLSTVETEYRVMVLIPSLSKRVPSFSYSSKIKLTVKIVE